MAFPRKTTTLAFILATLAIDTIGVGIVIPVLPGVIRRFLADEANVARVFGAFIAVYAAMQFLFAPLLGRLSDRFGRKPILLAALAGGAVDYLGMALAPTLGLLFVGRIVSGVSGASYSVASAAIADVSDDRDRSRNFGLIGAGFGIGFIIGPAIGGALAARDPRLPFIAAAAFNALNFALGACAFPETLAPSARRAFRFAGADPLASLRRLRAARAGGALVAVYVLLQLAGQTHPSIWTLYTQHRYGWDARAVGLSLALVGILSAVSQGALTGPIVRRFGERRTLLIGCCGQAMAFAGFAAATRGWMLYGILAFSSLFWASQPALQSLLSREVPSAEQGEFQGSLMSLASLVSIVNPLLMTAVFSAFSRPGHDPYLPGAPYALAAAFLVLAFALARRATAPPGAEVRDSRA